MGGGLAQLAAFGTADIYLTGNPTISYWKSVYKRYTAFAIESVLQSWNGTVDFNRKVTAQIARNGDLVYRMWLELTLPDLSTYVPLPNTATNIRWCNSIAQVVVNSVELEVGGTKLDRQSGEFMDMWSELTESQEKLAGFYEMIGKYDNYDITDTTGAKSSAAARTYYLPLQFYCCRAPGAALPYVALAYHDIKLYVEFRNALECVRCSTTSLQSLTLPSGEPLAITDCKLYVDFVYLSDLERKRFASIPHEYLIVQTQAQGDEAVLSTTLNRKVTINFQQPVIEIIWCFCPTANQQADTLAGNSWFDWDLAPGTQIDAFDQVSLLLNGHERFSPRSGRYFRLVTNYESHKRTPTKKVYSYSFALAPEDQAQPSGTINLSRIESAQFLFTMNPAIPNGVIKIYARSYNVLRIASGMAGIAFSGV